jgi:hypothetical protein
MELAGELGGDGPPPPGDESEGQRLNAS